MRRKESGAASIMDRYAIEFRSLKILRNSVLLSSVIEESDEQNKNEQHLTKKEIVCMYCRTLKAVKYLIFEIIYVIAIWVKDLGSMNCVLIAYKATCKGKLFTISIYTWRDVKGASEGRPRK